MKVVILAGGYGTRISEYTDIIPKPMVEIGQYPILWHIMNWYAKYGSCEFIIALGYKSEIIKSYFNNYHSMNSDFSVDLSSGVVQVINSNHKNWKVSLIDTGMNTMTGGRILRLKDIIGTDTFMVTYGDGLSDINIDELVEHHEGHGKTATISAVHPTARYGELELDDLSNVKSFKEKPQLDRGRINGGYFVFNSEVFRYLKNDETILEKDPMENLVRDGQLSAYVHNGFWQSMDTVREHKLLQDIWNSGKAPWK